MARNVDLQVLRGTFANIGTLHVGELYLTTDTERLYVGSAGGNILIGPSPGSGNFVQATVDFGSDTGPITRVFDAAVVVAATWVTAQSIILCTPAGVATSTHGVDDALLEGLISTVDNLNPGVGFTIRVYSPLGSFGQYVINAVGM